MKQPFFVIGLGRSGSTYLYHLLSDHPKIALTNEGHIADFLSFCSEYAALPAYDESEFVYFDRSKLRGMIPKRYSKRFAPLFQRHAIEILEDFYREEFASKDFTHWGDKLPSLYSVSGLQTIYPRAKFIILMRDPRDFCCSMLSYRESEDRAEMHPIIFEHSVEDWSIAWNNCYAQFDSYLTNKHLVRYEMLVNNPREELTKLLDFLELADADSIIAAAEQRDTFQGHGTARNPNASIGRWSRDLSAEDLQTIESICSESMQRYGYPLAED